MKKNILGLIVCTLLVSTHNVNASSNQASSARWVLPAVVVGVGALYAWNEYKNKPQEEPLPIQLNDSKSAKVSSFAEVDGTFRAICEQSNEQIIKEAERSIRVLEDKWQKEVDYDVRKMIDIDLQKAVKKLEDIRVDEIIRKAKKDLIESARSEVLKIEEKWKIELNGAKKVRLGNRIKDAIKEYEKYKKEYQQRYLK
jgi:hypothetical protein